MNEQENKIHLKSNLTKVILIYKVNNIGRILKL